MSDERPTQPGGPVATYQISVTFREHRRPVEYVRDTYEQVIELMEPLYALTSQIVKIEIVITRTRQSPPASGAEARLSA